MLRELPEGWPPAKALAFDRSQGWRRSLQKRGCQAESNSSEAGGLRRSVGPGQTAWAYHAGSEGLILGPGCKVKASSVHDTPGVLRSGHVLHGDSKSRRKRCC